MKLQKLSDFVLEQGHFNDKLTALNVTHNYATFLKQPLELWMFVPCGKDGKIMEKPINYYLWLNPNHAIYNENRRWLDKCEQYQQAEQRVLFDVTGFHLEQMEMYCDREILDRAITLEELVYLDVYPTLTQNAINQIFTK